MREGVVTIIVTFEDIIASNESLQIVPEMTKLAEGMNIKNMPNKPQIISLPFQDDQPAGVPICIVQLANRCSYVLTRQTLTCQVLCRDDMGPGVLVNRLTELLDKVLNPDRKTLGKKIKILTCSIAVVQEDLEYSEIQSIAKHLEQIIGLPASTNMGFSVARSETPSCDMVSYETINYSTMFSDADNKIGFRTERIMTLGGYNFSKKNYVKLTKNKISGFVDYINSSEFSELIGKTYGLSESE